MAESIAIFKPKVLLNGTALPSGDLQTITEIVVHQEICLPGMFSIELMAEALEGKRWDYLNFNKFNLGDEIEIYVNKANLIAGEIYSIEPKFDRDTGKVVIRGYDYLHRLRLGKKTNVYSDKKDSEIVVEIAKQNQITCSAEDTKSKHENIIQYGISDYKFLCERMKLTGFIFFYDGKDLIYKKADIAANATVAIQYPQDILDGEIYMTLESEYGDHQFNGWDEMKKEPFQAIKSAAAKAGFMGEEKSSFQRFTDGFGDQKNIFFSPEIVDQDMANNFIEGKFFDNSLNTVKGKLSVSGNEKIAIAKNVSLDGFGKFAGKYFVSEVKHVFKDNNLETEISVLRVGV
jgi:phage protein D